MNDPQPNSLIGWMQAFFGGGATTIIVAGLARLVWHGQEASAGRRPWLGPHIILEVPIAICMALVAESLASYLGMTQTVTTGVVAAISYLGPRGLRDAVCRVWPRPNT